MKESLKELGFTPFEIKKILKNKHRLASILMGKENNTTFGMVFNLDDITGRFTEYYEDNKELTPEEIQKIRYIVLNYADGESGINYYCIDDAIETVLKEREV